MYGEHRLRLNLFISGCYESSLTEVKYANINPGVSVPKRNYDFSPATWILCNMVFSFRTMSRGVNIHVYAGIHLLSGQNSLVGSKETQCELRLNLLPRLSYRFSAFWLRSKCSIWSYQLNIWYGSHVLPSILNWFLPGDEVQELAPALSRVDPVLQYRWDRPTSPLSPQCRRPHCHDYVYKSRHQSALSAVDPQK